MDSKSNSIPNKINTNYSAEFTGYKKQFVIQTSQYKQWETEEQKNKSKNYRDKATAETGVICFNSSLLEWDLRTHFDNVEF